MEKLTKDKIINISEGFDRVGRVMRVKGRNDKIFRIINDNYKTFFVSLLESGKIRHLFGSYLPETKISSDYQGENGELILEHKKIPDINYPYEWSREMIKDSGLFFLDLTLEMIKVGLFMKDSHPFNITFTQKKPIFFDYGSIEENKQRIKFEWIYHFFHEIVFPVNYFHISDGEKYRRSVITNLNRPFVACRFASFSLLHHPLYTLKALLKYRYFVKKCKKINNATQQISVIKELRDYIEELTISYPKTRWGNYYELQQQKLIDEKNWDEKMKNLQKIVKSLTPASLMDLAGNTGFYTELILKSATSLKKTIITDYDEVAVDIAYKKADKIQNCYVVDFNKLTQNTIVYWKPSKKTVYPSFLQRNQAEMVLMLALIHHLVYYQNTSFEYIIEVLNESSQKWIILEFISNQDFHVQKWFKKGIKVKEWYTLENLQKSLSKYFEILRILPSGNAREDRQLILCIKKNFREK